MRRHLLFLAILTATSAPLTSVAAQPTGVRVQHSTDRQATVDMRSRVAAAGDRIVSAEQHGKLSPARAEALRRQVAGAQRDMVRLSGRTGTLTAAQLAPYGRMVGAIDAELNANAGGRPYGNDALPSAEVTAFRKAHARLHYRDARIERDAKGCAVYQGADPHGQVRREPLRDPAGRPICSRR